MLEKPDIADATLVGYVRQGWAMDVVDIEFMPVGLDAFAWAYDVRTDTGGRHFLKVRRGDADLTGVRVAQQLHARGLTQVVAPINGTDGHTWYTVDGLRILLYPFVDGRRGSEAELTADQWRQYGAFLGALHQTPPVDQALPRDTFVCASAAGVREVSEYLATQYLGRNTLTDARHRELAEIWRTHEAEIAMVADRTDALGRLARAQGLPHVLCHADIHANNILVDPSGRLHVVDWDAPVLAPAERDLMFILDAADEDRALFWQGYGRHELNWAAVAYYLYQRAVEDIDSFAREVLFRDDLGDATAAQSLYWLRRQFGPNTWLASARRAEARISAG